MKIKITNIDSDKYTVREKLDKEHFDQLKDSLKVDGQWNPIIVRTTSNGKYALISGHYRVQAAKELGWEEIEAIVKDLTDDEADLLSLKTNLLRLEMSAREQGKVLHNLVERYKLSGSELARRLGVSETWVNKRIRLALDLHESVVSALESGKISFSIASVIGTLEKEKQQEFLDVIIKREIANPEVAVNLKNKYLNDTIFTIGYEGRKIDEFIDILLKNEIKLLVDVRASGTSSMKPEFNNEILERELKRNKILYKHYPDLGVPFILQNPYKDGKFGFECLKQWYHWHIENEVIFDDIVKYLKDSGRSVLMCMERYAKKMRDQKYNCHRDILADLIVGRKEPDALMSFKNRVDL